MKIAFLAGLICALCLLSVSKAAPTDGDSETVNAFNAQLAAENPETLLTLNRQKRFTSDVLKSEAACSSHCLVLGRWKGGYCRRGTCICRQ